MQLKKTLFIATAAFSIAAVSAAASTVNVNLEEEHQVIRGFGGMVHNGWQGGKGLSEADAKIAFGAGEGQLGLTVLRIPVNESSNDFGRELAAAKLAKSYGAIVYATPWDPPKNLETPYTLTRWGSTYNTSKISENNWLAYTNHLNSFAEYMKNQGVPLYAISIQNEPDWCDSWNCWSADELYKYTKNFADQLRKHGTKVITAESFAYAKNYYDQILKDDGARKNIDILGAHFYGSVAETADSYFKYDLADQKNTERWMTEHYTESKNSANMWRGVSITGDQDIQAHKDTVRALDVGYEIHRGLAIGNFSQYTWWYIRRCYGLIMETDFSNKVSVSSAEVGKVSKRGYVLSQFARFIRPGAVRVGATINSEPNVFASAYKSADGDSVIVVLINRDYQNGKTVEINIPGINADNFTKYTTSETKNVKNDGEVAFANGKMTVTLDKECIVTLVGTAPQVVIPQEPYKGVVAELPGKIEAENYDVPGSGKGNNSYYDNDSENKGGAYREDGVDIESIDDGFAVGYTNAGEWMEYTVNVKTAGEYFLSFRAASGSTSSSIQLFVDDEAVTDTIKVPQTAENDWSVYKEMDGGKVKLSAGKHILKIAITGSYVNLDWINFGTEPEDPQFANIRFDGAPSMKNFALFDLNGNLIARVSAYTAVEAKKNFVQSHNSLKNQVMIVRPIK